MKQMTRTKGRELAGQNARAMLGFATIEKAMARYGLTRQLAESLFSDVLHVSEDAIYAGLELAGAFSEDDAKSKRRLETECEAINRTERAYKRSAV